MTGFTVISNDTITSNILSDGAYRLYTLLCSYCYGDKDICYPSEKTLANALNRSVRTIQRYLKELVTNHLIFKKRRGSISNLYKVLNKVILNKVKDAVTGVELLQNKFKPKKSYFNNKKQSTFNSFTCNRKYDFKELEEKLLGWEKQYK